MNSNEIINFISNSEKKTPIKLYVKGSKLDKFLSNYEYYGNEKSGVVFCEYKDIEKIEKLLGNSLETYRIEMDRLNSAIPLADYSKYNARIEPGVHIRDMVEIGDGCVIMMGAVLNIGAQIGKNSMIDMNVVLGGRATVGENCHIGAGTVLAGVIEPPSAEPVIIEDNVLIGANAVVLEGVKVGKGSVVAAGSVVVKDVPENTLVAGIPAKEIKKIDLKTKAKTQMIYSLRQL